MYNIAIVEDQDAERATIRSMLDRFQKEENETFLVREFPSGLAFIADFSPEYDVIFLDIEMPHMSGMEVAHAIRKTDLDVCLIFITYMANYAIEGYEVQATDFMVKPVEYPVFSKKLRRALTKRDRLQKKEIVLNTHDEVRRVQIDDIYYVEVADHTLIYHTAQGDVSERGTIREREQLLKDYGFARCSNSFLVNLNYVQSVTEGKVVVKGLAIPIGRTKKKAFMQQLTVFLGDHI